MKHFEGIWNVFLCIFNHISVKIRNGGIDVCTLPIPITTFNPIRFNYHNNRNLNWTLMIKEHKTEIKREKIVPHVVIRVTGSIFAFTNCCFWRHLPSFIVTTKHNRSIFVRDDIFIIIHKHIKVKLNTVFHGLHCIQLKAVVGRYTKIHPNKKWHHIMIFSK